MKKFKMYDENGYFNFASLYDQHKFFNFIIGARGTGKTYSAIKFFVEKNKPFIFLRRTQVQCDIISTSEMSPIIKVLKDLKIEYYSKKLTKYNTAFYDHEKLICITGALKTFGNVRGFEASNMGINDIILDEFIKEPQEPSIKYEGMALMNAYESMNRNRFNNDDMRLFCFANSTDIANDIMMYFNILSIAENLLNTGKQVYFDNDRSVIIFQDSPISKKKEQTALYRNANEEFKEMALNNKFILNDFSYVKKRPINAYTPYLQVGRLYIYKHKSERQYYICFTKCKLKSEMIFKENYNDLERFKKKYWRLYMSYVDGYCRFENYEAVALFEKYFD